jgi:hypothetical protein
MEFRNNILTKSILILGVTVFGMIKLPACTTTQISHIKRAETLKEADCLQDVPLRMFIVGKEFAATTAVDVFYDQHDISEQQYEFFGEIIVMYSAQAGTGEPICAERYLVEQAKRRGANAVIIRSAGFTDFVQFSLTGRLVRYKK